MTLRHEDIDWSVLPKPAKTQEIKKAEPSEEEHKFITGVEGDETETKEPPEPEVRLISAEWKAGPLGFCYNEECHLQVKAEFLKKTIRAKIRGKLFGIYNGKEVDLNQEIVGELQSDGTGVIKIKYLWYIDEHYYALKEDPQVTCAYIVKGICHSRGANTIDSPVLHMPMEGDIRGGASFQIFSDYMAEPQNVNVTLKADDEEIYSGNLSGGVISVSNITQTNLILECELEGNKRRFPIQWFVGDGPFPVQPVCFHINCNQ